MWQNNPLPIDSSFQNIDEYIESLLEFIVSNELFKALSGGVHILGFFTVEPQIYASTLPISWRQWFALHDVPTILDLLLRENLSILEQLRCSSGDTTSSSCTWRGLRAPPKTLLDFIISIRRLSLERVPQRDAFASTSVRPPHSLVVGMKPKKIHETHHFATYIRELRAYVSREYGHQISHIVDFGSGQNYLGRTLASPPDGQRIIAVERIQRNIGASKAMDIHAKLVEKPKTMTNKKIFREQARMVSVPQGENANFPSENPNRDIANNKTSHIEVVKSSTTDMPIIYVEQNIENADLSYLDHVIEVNTTTRPADAQLLVISLHSCGDLLHYGLRSLTSNAKVKAVAMIGCCYHLNSDRIGPPTWKPPYSHKQQQSPDQTSLLGNPNGFPLSERLLTYRHRKDKGKGIKLNITARMMASQAAANWTEQDCESFFTRHFYRALLQKIFLDCGVLASVGNGEGQAEADTEELGSGPDLPITIGSLRKACYTSFVAYVRGAMQKLSRDQRYEKCVNTKIKTLTDEDLSAYEAGNLSRKKEVSIMWSLMAFVASVTESILLVDRFLYLKEQSEVDKCWVEPVFDFGQSPRNLAVIGIKK